MRKAEGGERELAELSGGFALAQHGKAWESDQHAPRQGRVVILCTAAFRFGVIFVRASSFCDLFRDVQLATSNWFALIDPI